MSLFFHESMMNQQVVFINLHYSYTHKCGNIKFYDPIDQKSMQSPNKKELNDLSSEVITVVPNEGDLLIFPSYLHHSVEENLSEDERIVISFNIEILKNR